MSGKSIETCYICSEHSPRSSCYNIQIGYSTVFCCTIECSTIVNSYLYASSHYKTFSLENVEKAVDHDCKQMHDIDYCNNNDQPPFRHFRVRKFYNDLRSKDRN